ncbi:oligosaccharide flippase family protein [Bacillus sp. CMF12]|uniref:oligosaccharide flippase family protein n=1 Tax=Bacillus sp. CMF12 TaxID=2884834 RepID=UPI00207998E6|nr:oligosaccharide flippase family protein [Bacillus sp. CMF12]USK49621.1 oligosaccharide flippase family protein [Bacillus sp. CMF12]
MKIITKVLKKQSNRNIFTLLIGTSAAQAIPVLASLVLTRLYTPEEFGLLAVFLSIVSLLGSIVTLRYELAILVPTKEQDAVNVTILSILSSTVFSTIIFIILLLFKVQILTLLNINSLGNWIYLIPVTILFLGLYSSLSFLATRAGIFKVISQTRVYQTLTGSVTQIILGIMQFGVGGLVIGAILTNLMGNIKIFGRLLDSYANEFSNIKFNEIKNLARKYSDYPIYSVPSTIFNNASIHIMSFVIPVFYSTALLGQYSLSQRILILPMKVISNSISQVFLNEASKELQANNTTKNAFKSTFKKLMYISIPLYLILFLIIEDLITFAFGIQWQQAGEISKILIILLFFRFVVSPLSNVLNLYEKQRIVFLWQLSLLVLTLISLFISIWLKFSILKFLYTYVLLLSADYILMFFISLYFSSRNKES